MSNRVAIQRTRFTNLRTVVRNGAPGLDDENAEESFGFRAYDDFDTVYNNCLDSAILMRGDAEFLQYLDDLQDDVLGDLIGISLMHGLYIDHNWYDAEWVQNALREE